MPTVNAKDFEKARNSGRSTSVKVQPTGTPGSQCQAQISTKFGAKNTSAIGAKIWADKQTVGEAWIKIPYFSSTCPRRIVIVASNKSSDTGENVFEFFDDFDTLDTSTKWDIIVKSATVAVTNNQLDIKLTSSSHCGGGVIAQTALTNGDYIVEARLKTTDAPAAGEPGFHAGFTSKEVQDTTYYGEWGTKAGGALYGYPQTGFLGRLHSLYQNGATQGSSTTIPTFQNVWVRISAVIRTSTKNTIANFKYETSGITYGPLTSPTGETAEAALYPYIYHAAYAAPNEHSYCDWFFVRKYQVNEPICGTGIPAATNRALCRSINAADSIRACFAH